MCRRVVCEKCGRPSYAGCGMHVDQVLGDVPRDQRCQCRMQKATSGLQGADARAKKRWWQG